MVLRRAPRAMNIRTRNLPDTASIPRSRGVLPGRIGLAALLCALLFVSAVAACGLGPVRIPPLAVARAVLSLIPFLHAASPDALTRTVVLDVRLPRILLALLIGGALAGAGTAFQSLLRNDLAEPYTLGVSAGAALAAGIVIATGAEALWSGLLLPSAAFFGSLAVLALVYALARQHGRVEVRSLLLAGVVVSAFLWSAQLALFKVAGKSTDEVLSWLLGHLSSASWRDVEIVAVTTLSGLFVLAFQTGSMNVFSLGEEQAQQLGIKVDRLKSVLTLTGSLLTAGAVAVTGIIGFVGLIAPHIARRLAGTPDNRVVLPLSVLCGALITLWSDTVARLVLGGDALPVGVITAFLGGPFFAYLLRREKG